MNAKQRAVALNEAIVKACIKYKLNLTIHEGKLGFVDQENKKIVATAGFNHCFYKLTQNYS